MRLRLERLEGNRFDSSIVYILLALLAAALLAAAFFWNRARKSVAMVADWSRANDPLVAEADAAALAGAAGSSRVQSAAVPLAPDSPRSAARPAPKAPVQPAAPVADPEIDESLFQDLKKLKTVTLPQTLSPLAPAAAAAAVASASTSRGLSPEDFFDVQQHADFFVSLGQYDQAIDVLKRNIDENIEVSPLAYLELLKIYHTLSRQDDYEELRENFNRIFNGKVPPFASFHDEGRGLEDYPAALLAIESHWGTPQVLDDIESNLYRTPGASSEPAFDLAAYREFLMLYAVAKANMRRGGAPGDAPLPRPARSAPITFNSPLSAPAPLAPSRPSPAAPLCAPVAPLAPSLSAMMLDDPLAPEPVVGDGSHTQPMLLMPDTSHRGLDTPPARPDVPSYKQPLDLDLDLDLNLDFSNSELQSVSGVSGMSGVEDRLPPELPSLDLPDVFPPTLPPEQADPPPGFPPATSLDSNLIEFDLFDPTIEAKISPKK
jgi:pilus assembly protein FimV